MVNEKENQDKNDNTFDFIKVLETYKERSKVAVSKMVSAPKMSNKIVDAYKELLLRIEILEKAQQLYADIKGVSERKLLLKQQEVFSFIEKISFDSDKSTTDKICSVPGLYSKLFQEKKKEILTRSQTECLLQDYIKFWLSIRESIVKIEKEEKK